jgi:hypothetical protein
MQKAIFASDPPVNSTLDTCPQLDWSTGATADLYPGADRDARGGKQGGEEGHRKHQPCSACGTSTIAGVVSWDVPPASTQAASTVRASCVACW